jgi:hypothetical protein
MTYKTIPAHYDGEKICLDEPTKLKRDEKLFVTIVSDIEVLREENFHTIAFAGLSQAYGEDEPTYTALHIREPNSEYRT